MGIIIWQYHSTPWTKRNLSLFLLPSFRHLYRSHSHFTLLFSFLLFFVLSSSPNEAGFVLIGSHASSFLFRSRHASRMRFRPPCIWRAVVTVVSEIILDTHGIQISVIPGAFHSPPHGLPRVPSIISRSFSARDITFCLFKDGQPCAVEVTSARQRMES